MSWSRSLGGSRASVLAMLVTAASEVETIDRGYNAAPGVISGHQDQIAAVKNAVDLLPENAQITGSVSGHAGANGDGTLYMQLSYVQIPAVDAQGANASGQIVETPANPVEQDDVLPSVAEGSEA